MKVDDSLWDKLKGEKTNTESSRSNIFNTNVEEATEKQQTVSTVST